MTACRISGGSKLFLEGQSYVISRKALLQRTRGPAERRRGHCTDHGAGLPLPGAADLSGAGDTHLHKDLPQLPPGVPSLRPGGGTGVLRSGHAPPAEREPADGLHPGGADFVGLLRGAGGQEDSPDLLRPQRPEAGGGEPADRLRQRDFLHRPGQPPDPAGPAAARCSAVRVRQAAAGL